MGYSLNFKYRKIQSHQNKILPVVTVINWYIRKARKASQATKSSMVKIEKLDSFPKLLARNILNFRNQNRLRRGNIAAPLALR